MQFSQMSQRQAATKIQARVRGRAARRPRPAAGGRPTLAWAIEEVVAGNTGAGLEAEIDRERLCCDILNTAVMGALVGGFALSNMTSSGDGNTLDNLIYLFSCLSVHACTCSCLTSALLYRTAVRMRDDAVAAWAAAHKLLLMLPLAKFGMGCVSYLLSVILLSFRDLDHSSTFQYTPHHRCDVHVHSLHDRRSRRAPHGDYEGCNLATAPQAQEGARLRLRSWRRQICGGWQTRRAAAAEAFRVKHISV